MEVLLQLETRTVTDSNSNRDHLRLALKRLSRTLKAGKAGAHSVKGYKRHDKHKKKKGKDK